MPAETTARAEVRASWFSEAAANLGLGLPIAVAYIAEMAVVFINNVMVGRLGATELAAGGLGGYFIYSPLLLGMGVLGGVAAVAAHAHGAGDHAKVAASARQGLRLTILLSLPCIGLLLALSLLVLPHLGYERAVVEMVQGLLIWALPGIPAFLAFTALRNFVTALHRPRVVTVVAVAAVGVAALVNYVFIYGALGAPRLGVAGVGLSTSICAWAQFLAVAIYIACDSGFRRYRVFARLGRSSPVLGEILHVGWPIAGAYMFENGLFLCTAVLVGLFSAAALAAHTIVIGLCAFTFMVPYAVGQAATVRVGHALGAARPARARRAGFVALHLGVIWMACTASAFLTLPRLLIGLYIKLDDPANAATLAVALLLLPIAALFQVFDGTQAVAVGVLRGFKDTRQPMLICFIGYWLIGIASGSLLGFGFHLGVIGLWIGLLLGLAATAILLSLRFHRQSLKRLA